MKIFRAVLAVALFLSSTSRAEEVQMQVMREPVGIRSFAAAPRIVERAQIPSAVTLQPAAEEIPEQLEAMREWNAARRQPARNGVIRTIGETMAVRLGGVSTQSNAAGRGVTAATDTGTAWGTSLTVRNAKRLRAHLQKVELPAGATLWVYGTTGEAIAFDAALLDGEKSLWTPSVDGDKLHLEIEVPSGTSASFEINEVLELVYARGAAPRPATEDTPTCLNGQDVNCQTATEFPALAAVRKAIGQMEFVSGSNGAVCSGALINDQQSSSAAYFLTANHCISTQSAASSLETYFDYVFASCVSGNASTLPAVNGSTLMATSATTDVTLVRLNTLPSNRVRLGWSTNPLTAGTKLHRISHPFPDSVAVEYPQMYSRTIVTTTSNTCSSLPRPNFIYSNELNGGEGGVYGGSSGSAAILSDSANDARIVGQLFGSCGPEASAGCDRRNFTVDGAFAASFSVLQPFLAPTAAGVCTPNASTICLMDNRFSVRLTYNTGQGALPMTAIKYTGDTGLFWFANAANIEILLKMVNACSFNSRYWVFVGGTTDVGVVITVTDTKNGTVKTYNHARGTNFVTITDTGAFATCP
jgi:lysyl endopeptidase